ncbi:MAG: Crp/Fnr family transcriptional regulator, partial [Clostridia bacterium]|nr:Crp/Fnr family transcriptional regulator [Clostridia bacterium]
MLQVSEFFPIWNTLSAAERARLEGAAVKKSVPAGALLHNGNEDCMGLLLVSSGQLRIYTTSDDGREVTLYRLLERDICLFSASCMLHSIQFDLQVSAERDTEFWLVSPEVYSALMKESAPIANFTSSIMASRFTEVMWLIDQLLWKRMDQRIAKFLLEEASLNDSSTLKITHETIAGHLGTAREVVTRMLKYFQSEGAVKLSRGTVTIL